MVKDVPEKNQSARNSEGPRENVFHNDLPRGIKQFAGLSERGYQIPISFHHTGPMPSQMIRLITEIQNP
jgi:hypothetical protein